MKKKEKKNSEKIILEEKHDPIINISLNTIKMNKQALIFSSTKRSAEKTAEEIAKKIFNEKITNKGKLKLLSENILHSLNTPTKQCERLSRIVLKGIAFHHSGLSGKQKFLLEEAFRKGDIKIIVATPTLAVGVDLPSFRTIIKDVKRFSNYGMIYIPVLEYLQMAGRSGRPNYDTYGESIILIKNNNRKEIIERYIYGKPESITSKLAVEPALRSHVLSLINTEVYNKYQDLLNFFEKSFYGYQYSDKIKLKNIIDRILLFLEKKGFIKEETNNIEKKEEKKIEEKKTEELKENKKNEEKNNKKKEVESLFTTAKELYEKKEKKIIEKNKEEKAQIEKKYYTTRIGKRISELYLDPYSASIIIKGLKKIEEKNKKEETNIISYLNLISYSLELKPYPTIKKKDYEMLEEFYIKNKKNFLFDDEEELFEYDYEFFLKGIKLTLILLQYIDEKDENYLFENYDITPGELYSKKEIVDWLLYSSYELARILNYNFYNKFSKLRIMLKYGVREELLSLISIKDIGRKRARMLYEKRIKNVNDIKNTDLNVLKKILGEKLALKIKKASIEKKEKIEFNMDLKQKF